MRILDSILGSIAVEITTAAPENLLQILNLNGARLRDVRYLDPLTVRLDIKRMDYSKVRRLSEKTDAEVRILKRNGIYWSIKKLAHRPCLLLGIIALLLLTFLLPARILFVEVKGNELLPTPLILEKADICGIGFGASRRAVRSETTKNKLLSVLPELRWAGVNTYGCVAVITVQEKPVTQEKPRSEGVRHVVATKDGIISGITIMRGAGQCRQGQAVNKGQVLVSGYIDHGISIEGICADAEIFGYTGNILYVHTPTDRYIRGEKKPAKTKYQLLVGKKLINFSKDSGISDTECVRMYEERYLTLPGGFRLPVALICETVIPHSTVLQRNDMSESYTWLENAAEKYLHSQMLSGEILHSNTLTECNDGLCTLYGTYQCREIIGRVRSEEKLIADE